MYTRPALNDQSFKFTKLKLLMSPVIEYFRQFSEIIKGKS